MSELMEKLNQGTVSLKVWYSGDTQSQYIIDKVRFIWWSNAFADENQLYAKIHQQHVLKYSYFHIFCLVVVCKRKQDKDIWSKKSRFLVWAIVKLMSDYLVQCT